MILFVCQLVHHSSIFVKIKLNVDALRRTLLMGLIDVGRCTMDVELRQFVVVVEHLCSIETATIHGVIQICFIYDGVLLYAVDGIVIGHISEINWSLLNLWDLCL